MYNSKNDSATRRLLFLSLFLAAPVIAQPVQPASIVQVASVARVELAPTVAVPGTIYSRYDVQVTAGSVIIRLALKEVEEAETLAAAGCTFAVGPMNRNTWGAYRLIVERGEEPLFFSEPDNPDDWPDHWLRADFETVGEYSSPQHGTNKQAGRDHRGQWQH